MRKNVFIGLLLIANFLFSQSIDYDKVISELRQKEKQECVKNPINCSAFSSQIQATIIELENRRDAEKNNYSNQLQKQEAEKNQMASGALPTVSDKSSSNVAGNNTKNIDVYV